MKQSNAAKNQPLHVIIDDMMLERKQIMTIEDVTFIRRYSANGKEMTTTGRVFKDYILSSEVFKIDSVQN